LRDKIHSGKEIKSSELYTIAQTSEGNKTKLHLDRDYFTHGLIPAIAEAKDSIHLAMLTLDGGELGEFVVDLLIQKKQENPDIAIRILVDDFGSDALFCCSAGSRNLQRLTEVGIDVELNHFFLEGMEHRKLLIVDGKKAFFGGACFGDEYFGNEEFWDAYTRVQDTPDFDRRVIFYPESLPKIPSPFEITPEMELPEYHDFGVEFEGPTVRNLQASFLQTWMLQENDLEPNTDPADFISRYFPQTTVSETDTAPIKLVHGIPKGESEYRQSILEIIDAAKGTLDLHFAYILIPEFINAVKAAAERGVQVRILIPGEEGTDKESTWSAFRYYYPRLLRTGNVEIYEFHTYNHCKFLVADKRLIFTSTGNPEYNSWENGTDETALIDSPKLADEIERRVFDVDLAENRSRQIQLDEVTRISIWARIKQWFYLLLFFLFQRPTEPRRPRRNLVLDPDQRQAQQRANYPMQTVTLASQEAHLANPVTPSPVEPCPDEPKKAVRG